jgi:hypothetical protein
MLRREKGGSNTEEQEARRKRQEGRGKRQKGRGKREEELMDIRVW